VTLLGYAGLLWIAFAGVVALVERLPVAFTVALTAASVWTADLLATGLKALIDRPRPFDSVPEADPLIHGTIGSALPSGHAATSFAGAVVLSAFAPRAAPGFFLLAVAISFSRVYVGVHYPSDVLAGVALGALVGLLALLAVRRLPRRGGSPRPRSRAPRSG
jgi:undecaprenyl-diphosphatase